MGTHITFQLEELKPQDAEAIIAMLRVKTGVVVPMAFKSETSAPPPAAEVIPAEVIPAEAEGKKRGPGRPKKEQTADAPPQVTVEASSIQEPDAALSTTPATDLAVYTRDGLQTELQKVMDKSGMDGCKALLTEFKCQRISEILELDIDQQNEFVKRCNA